ncbi:hypothetical protein [Streptosporangium sp. NBC_01469]|uniref:hypothetical protein n=1 Tax=Streptosporangium sp. NBC_01469 TaxID=2903898 RepID=UPI002E2E4454|nr:hypothetical protein [Streptosporangium sp. NBC_01469]
MTLFEAHIDAIENAAKAALWVCFIATFVLLLTGHVNMSMAIVIAVVWISRATLYHIKETRARWDDKAAEEGELRREQRHANRERELLLQIRRLQRPEGRGDGSSVGGP